VKAPVKARCSGSQSRGAVALGAPLLEIADHAASSGGRHPVAGSVGCARACRHASELGTVAPLAAQVRRIEPAAFPKISALGVEEQRVNVVLDFTEPLDRLQTIGDGFRVEAHIVVWRADDAVKVPVGALFRDGPGWAVFVIEDGYARKRAIKTARRNPVEALVEDGLQPNQSVVIYPPDALKDGVKVAVTKAKGR
jgi:HlyD family secretion protein